MAPHEVDCASRGAVHEFDPKLQGVVLVAVMVAGVAVPVWRFWRAALRWVAVNIVAGAAG